MFVVNPTALIGDGCSNTGQIAVGCLHGNGMVALAQLCQLLPVHASYSRIAYTLLCCPPADAGVIQVPYELQRLQKWGFLL